MEKYKDNPSLKKQDKVERNEADSINNDLENPERLLINKEAIENKGLFLIKPANEWLELAKTTRAPQMLFSEFWHEDEICILFADSNLGKSILAVQIANSISKGKQINGFVLEAKKQPVLYFDFELSAKQFEFRYAVKSETQRGFSDHYAFDQNFIRVEFNPNCELTTESSTDKYLYQSLEGSIIETGAKILIVDNITYLKDDTERSKDALPLMKYLKSLKSKHGLSILALAHTPKRDLTKNINQNDLGGSKMLYNFIDSCFALGKSTKDENIRYIKQIKARNTGMIYGAENVVMCELNKPINFLNFEFLEYGSEWEHLKHRENEISEKTKQRVKDLSKKGMSQRDIKNECSIGLGSVNKILNN